MPPQCDSCGRDLIDCSCTRTEPTDYLVWMDRTGIARRYTGLVSIREAVQTYTMNLALGSYELKAVDLIDARNFQDNVEIFQVVVDQEVKRFVTINS